MMVRKSVRGWGIGFDRYGADDADGADDAVTMMVRKSVRGWEIGFDRYDAMTQMTQMTQER